MKLLATVMAVALPVVFWYKNDSFKLVSLALGGGYTVKGFTKAPSATSSGGGSSLPSWLPGASTIPFGFPVSYQTPTQTA